MLKIHYIDITDLSYEQINQLVKTIYNDANDLYESYGIKDCFNPDLSIPILYKDEEYIIHQNSDTSVYLPNEIKQFKH